MKAFRVTQWCEEGELEWLIVAASWKQARKVAMARGESMVEENFDVREAVEGTALVCRGGVKWELM